MSTLATGDAAVANRTASDQNAPALWSGNAMKTAVVGDAYYNTTALQLHRIRLQQARVQAIPRAPTLATSSDGYDAYKKKDLSDERVRTGK